MEYNEDYQLLCSDLYNKLMKNYVRFARYQKKPRKESEKFNEHHLRIFAANCDEGRTLFNASNTLYEKVINSAIYYLTQLSDKNSDEYIEYVKTKNKKTNNKFNKINNLKKIEKRIGEGTYMTREEHINMLNKKKAENAYKSVVDAYETCVKAKIKPTIKKIMEISNLSKPTVVKYRKMYLESLGTTAIDVNRIIKKKKDK